MKTVYFKDPAKENIEAAAKIIRDGGLLAIPTETVYGLGDGDELAVSQQPGCGGNVLRTLRREHLCFHDLSLLSLRRSFSA